MMLPMGRKIYLEMPAPSEEDRVPADERVYRSLRSEMGSDPDADAEISMTLEVLRSLHTVCRQADWKVTVFLAWDGSGWVIVRVEKGRSELPPIGLAVDLGSTSVVMRMVDLQTGECLGEAAAKNEQIRYGEDILTRIFYCKDRPERLEKIRTATVHTICALMDRLGEITDLNAGDAVSMAVAGNTTMMHFLLGLDAFSVFQSPYAVETLDPGFMRGRDLDIPIKGWVYCFPGFANYLGGDIVSGILATGIYKKQGISLFFDVGTNGELVVGNREFLLCGAGAAGPALEGGVVRTGMRAADGAVEAVKMMCDKCANATQNNETVPMHTAAQNNADAHMNVAARKNATTQNNKSVSPEAVFHLTTIGDLPPIGICGSGIVDLIAELFLHGWVDMLGNLQIGKSPLIQKHLVPETGEEEPAVCYAPGLWFYQSDIQEFIRTKAAAVTMIEYMLDITGIGMDNVEHFYMAGSFGEHINKESAVVIGMYPDVDRNRLVPSGNTSLEGAQKLLLNRALQSDIRQILELMSYVQFGAVDDFLTRMRAAQALPHTDMEKYPSVLQRL